MPWAIALEGRSDQTSLLLLFEDRLEAESIAGEVRRRGHRVVVRPYRDRPAPRVVPQAHEDRTA